MASDDDAHNRRYAEAIHAARDSGDGEFQSWFNRSDSVEESLRRGCWDFSVHILTPDVVRNLRDPGSLSALEIGYGGGRLLYAASSFFGEAIGVDVHDEADAVAAMLASLGRDNVRLLRTDGRTLPVPDASVDFVYSFIVLQHLPSLAVLSRYLEETHRALRPGGVAQLYFGRLPGWNPVRRFREIPDAAVNHTSLELAPRFARRLCRGVGFRVVGRGVSHKNVPDGYPDAVGGQAYLSLVKPRANTTGSASASATTA